MQCEICHGPGTEHITEIDGGKIVNRCFCPQHAHGHLGVSEQEWTEFYDWIAPYFKQHGKLPPIDEIAKHDKLGAGYANGIRDGWEGVLKYIQIEIQKHLSARPVA
jgi:hypothetical protein